MKKSFVLIFLLLLLVVGFSLAIAIATQSKAQTSNSQTAQPNYILGPHVIGSGGVMAAAGPNNRHWATAGQTVVGGMAGTNNMVLAGFWHLPVFIPTGVNTEAETGLPTSFELHQNYPNPFNPQTTIRYDLPTESLVTVEIFNVVGQRIRLLLNGQIQGPGAMQVVWNGRNEQGKILSSGLYLYRITASAASSKNILFQDIKKMLFVK